MKAQPRSYLVTALAGVVGAVFPEGELLAAHASALAAKANGFEGKLLTVFDDGTIREFDLIGKTWAAELPVSPFDGAAAVMPERKSDK